MNKKKRRRLATSLLTDKQFKIIFLRMLHYFRQRPDRAAEMLLGQKFVPIQRIVLLSAWHFPYVMIILTRGGGKTFMLAILTLLRAILYPKQRVGIIAASFRQAKMVFNEIKRIYIQSSILQQMCIKPPITAQDMCYLHLKNRSEIEAVPLGDGSKIRGSRYYYIVLDERAQIPKDILDKVVLGMTATIQDPVNNVIRQMILRKYGIDLNKGRDISENHIISASTAFYQFNHWWKTVNQTVNTILEKKTADDMDVWKYYSVIKASYDLYPKGFISETSIMNAKESMSEYEFLMEYKTYFPPEAGGFYSPQLILNAVSLKKEDTILLKKKEKRRYLLFVDPAKSDDFCSFTILELPSKYREYALIVYVHVMEHKDSITKTKDIALFIWQLYGLFLFDMIGIDAGSGGAGRTIQELLGDSKECPAGMPLFYDPDDDFSYEDEHRHEPKKGLHILQMIDFTNKWLYEANHMLKASLEHKSLMFPRPVDSDDLKMLKEEESLVIEDVEYQIQKTKQELMNVSIHESSQGNILWRGIKKSAKSDRYSSLLGANYLYKMLYKERKTGSDLPVGNWVGGQRTAVGLGKYAYTDISVEQNNDDIVKTTDIFSNIELGAYKRKRNK